MKCVKNLYYFILNSFHIPPSHRVIIASFSGNNKCGSNLTSGKPPQRINSCLVIVRRFNVICFSIIIMQLNIKKKLLHYNQTMFTSLQSCVSDETVHSYDIMIHYECTITLLIV